MSYYRDRHFALRLNQKEFDMLENKSEDLEISKSELIRSLIEGVVPDYKLNAKILELNYELKKIGININQIAKYANQTGIINEAMLKTTLKNLELVRKEIINNLLNKKYGCNKFMENN